MFADLGLTGWALIALAWIAAGLALAWLFGAFVKAGNGQRDDRRVPSAVGLYAERQEASAAPAAGYGPVETQAAKVSNAP